MISFVVVLFIEFARVFCELPPGNRTDFSVCKVSHLGVEYHGSIGKTESNVRCQTWTSNEPHKVADALTDDTFPFGSKRASKNYCRNPDRKEAGPWCYSMSNELIDETCAVPLCSFSECRITGPGMEYGGPHSKGVSDRACLKWDKERKKVLLRGNYTKYSRFGAGKFPDLSLSKAKTYCRNPDGDLGGPWCFVKNEEQGFVEREYCDIPFCYDPECSGFAKNHDTYTHYIDFNGSVLTDIKFGLKLWNSDRVNEASARLVLSVLALPLTGQEIDDLGIGIEIFISNNQSALRFGNKDRPEYEPTPGLLTSTNFTTFTLNWDRGFITFGVEGRVKPIFLAEMRTKNTLMEVQKDRFDFYSVQGTDVIWNFPFCLDDDECDVHTTVGAEFQQFWPLRQKDIVYDLYVHVRAFGNAAILATPSPTVDFPYFKIVFNGPHGNTRMTVREYQGGSELVLKELQLDDVVDYWAWHEFSISFFANSLQIYMKKPIGMHSLLETTNEVFRQLRWFSVGSENSVAHWSLYCQPPRFAQPTAAVLPDCAINTNEPDYSGTQDVTSLGLPCLPWSGRKMLPDDVAAMFNNRSLIVTSKNYCRDPESRGEGTFCYALSRNLNKTTVEKQFCHLRKCKSQLCKMAGTGNDFIGHLSTTRSGRTCDNWDVSSQSVHHQYMYTFNDSYFADIDATSASNFCRNPNRDVSGSWCYTKDPDVVQDVCPITDCDRPEELIIIVSTNQNGRRLFILPQWKEEGLSGGLRFGLKEWNPDLLSGAVFAIYPLEGNEELVLVVGAALNEKVELYLNGALVESKTYPHLISAGVWTDFWLQIRRGEIMLGFKGVPTPLFEWKHPDMAQAFDPVFSAYHSLFNDMPIGFFFQKDECHTENTTDNNFLKFLPIGLYSEAENKPHTNLSLKMRGIGQIWVSLMWVTNNLNSYQIQIDSVLGVLSLNRVEAPPRGSQGKLTLLEEKQVPHLLTTSNWTHFYLSWTEHVLDIKVRDQLVLRYESNRPILIYWFSVAAAAGWATWSANCNPLDLDGPPVDGGWSKWSSWTCSVSCGGGEGFRTRTCSNPHPNIFGKLCQGSPTATGVCNDFPCGDVALDTLEEIRENLRKRAYSFVVSEGESVVLMNDRKMLKTIRKQSPEAYFEWTLNGVFINVDDRVIFQGDDVNIKAAKPQDAGVYVSMIYRPNNHRVVLKVISLAVRAANYDLDTRATLTYILQCHSVILGYVYADLSLTLTVNNVTYLDHGVTTLAAVNAHQLIPLNESNSGAWQCVVKQKDLNLHWVTNHVKLNVKKAPNFFTHLMEDRLTAPIFGLFRTEQAVLAAVICLTVAVFCAVVGCLILYLKFCHLEARVNRTNRRFQ